MFYHFSLRPGLEKNVLWNQTHPLGDRDHPLGTGPKESHTKGVPKLCSNNSLNIITIHHYPTLYRFQKSLKISQTLSRNFLETKNQYSGYPEYLKMQYEAQPAAQGCATHNFPKHIYFDPVLNSFFLSKRPPFLEKLGHLNM